jgi:hypothetical protein
MCFHSFLTFAEQINKATGEDIKDDSKEKKAFYQMFSKDELVKMMTEL